MAEIYLGKQLGEDGFARLCCIKKILPQFAVDLEFVQMFRDEAHISKGLQHANIVRVEGFEEISGSYALIMEFVPGADLRSILNLCRQTQNRLSVPMILYIIAEVCRGLHYAHCKVDELTGRPLSLVHRDISPQNIMISYEGEVKLTDFGIADIEQKNVETKTGIVKGKFAYMSPEQISAKKDLDARSDIFAVAVVMWEALAMESLFTGDSDAQTINLVNQAEIRKDILDLNLDVSLELKKIVLRGLQREPKQRYASAGELEGVVRKYLHSVAPEFRSTDLAKFLQALMSDKRRALQRDLQDLLQSSSPPVQPKPTPQPRVRHKPKSKNSKPLLWLGVFLVIIVGALSYGIKKLPQKNTQLTIEAVPKRVKILVNAKSLGYLDTPRVLILPLGKHSIRLERRGYKTVFWKVEATGEKVYKSFTLDQDSAMAPTEIWLSPVSKYTVNLLMGEGEFVGTANPGKVIKFDDLVFGERHMLQVSSEEGLSFACSFIPRSRSWAAPFLLEIIPEEERCKLQARR